MKPKRLAIHFHGAGCKDLAIIRNHLELIMTTVQDLAARVEAQTAQVAKIGEETRSLVATVEALTAALQQVELPADATAALDALDAQLAIVDGLVADLPLPGPDPVVDPADPVA